MLKNFIAGEFLSTVYSSNGAFWFIVVNILFLIAAFIWYSHVRLFLVWVRTITIFSLVELYSIPRWAVRGKKMDNFNMWTPVFEWIWKWTLEYDLLIEGEEIVPDDIPCIVVCNHQSYMDAFTGVLGFFPVLKRCIPIVKWECHYLFPLSLYMYFAGFCFVKRSDPVQCNRVMNEAISKIKKGKGKMWIFPEGTRSQRKNLLPFKKSAFRLALQHQLPIIPIVISPYRYPWNDSIPNSHKVIARILPIIPTENIAFDKEQVDKLTQSTWELMNSEFHKLDDEITKLTGHSIVYSQDN